MRSHREPELRGSLFLSVLVLALPRSSLLSSVLLGKRSGQLFDLGWDSPSPMISAPAEVFEVGDEVFFPAEQIGLVSGFVLKTRGGTGALTLAVPHSAVFAQATSTLQWSTCYQVRFGSVRRQG